MKSNNDMKEAEMPRRKKGAGIRSDTEDDSTSRYAKLHTLCTRAIADLGEKGADIRFIEELIEIRDETCDKTVERRPLSAQELQRYHTRIEGLMSAAELRGREQRGENIQDLMS